MLKLAIVAVASLIFLAAIILGYVAFSGLGGQSGYSECVTEDHCQLSLCDCECHPKGQTPEELQEVVCGKNCLEWFGVTGCDCVGGTCTTIKK